LGDGVTSTGHRVMAAVFDGDPQPLYDVIFDPAADEYIRSRMCEALAVVTLRGEMPREQAARAMTPFGIFSSDGSTAEPWALIPPIPAPPNEIYSVGRVNPPRPIAPVGEISAAGGEFDTFLRKFQPLTAPSTAFENCK
jgi:hypothetical protein